MWRSMILVLSILLLPLAAQAQDGQALYGKYCSQWPPGDQWDCYFLEALRDGNTLRFVGESGAVTQGQRIK